MNNWNALHPLWRWGVLLLGSVFSLVVIWSLVWQFMPVSTRRTLTMNLNSITQSDSQVPTSAITVEGTLDRIPTLYDNMLAQKVPTDDVLAVVEAFGKVYNFKQSRPTDRFTLWLNNDRRIQKFVYRTGPLDVYCVVQKPDGTLNAYKESIFIKKETIAKTFEIKSTLYQAFLDQGELPELVSRYTDIFQYDIDFFLYPKKGDRMIMYFEKYTRNGEFVRYGNILVAYYEGRKLFKAFRWTVGDKEVFFAENGDPLIRQFLKLPVKYGVLTSTFSTNRFHPIYHIYRRHTGIDYGVASGSNIYATATGTVRYAGWEGGYGKVVKIRHSNGYETYYGHCTRVLVRPGQTVDRGDVVALSGSTGDSTGPHVHYEVRINGSPVNPETLDFQREAPLSGRQLAQFNKRVDENIVALEQQLHQAPVPMVAENKRIVLPRFITRITEAVY